MMQPDTRMCRGALYQSAFAAIGLPVYDSTLYPGGVPMSDYKNCLRIGAELGLCTEGTSYAEIVTGGETAVLFHVILTREFEIEQPPMLSELSKAGVNMNDYLLALREVPEPAP